MVGSRLNVVESMGFVELGRSEAERSEAERSGGSTKRANGGIMVGAPDPEVSSSSGRRRFSAAYKARIVRKADACRESGDIGALLRREGLYSSQLAQWRQQYRDGAEAALADDKRERKRVKNPLEPEVERLCRELERANKKLKQAELIIEFQKNLCEILGISPTSVSSDGEK